MNPRTLLYDLETSSIEAHVWKTWQTDVIRIIRDWDIICFAYKWLGEDKVHFVAQWDFDNFKPGVRNDKYVVEALWRLLNEADVVIGHNSKSFDDKKSQARMMVHNLPPPSPFRQIDTKLEMKRVSAHSSNSLKDLAKSLDLDPKDDPGGFDTWIDSMNGVKKAQKHFKKYNIQDVKTLEELYLKLRPWIKNHPSMNLDPVQRDKCPKCGVAGKMQSRGFVIRKINKVRRFQCLSCGGWSQARKPEPVKEYPDYVN